MVKIINHEVRGPETEASGVEAGISLDSLKPGQSGTILGVYADPVLKLHLMELGFVPGSPIAFLMSTPFRDPNIYALRGTSIALRKSEAECIRVRN
jgi:ferrous iron transport protein A